MQRIKLKFENEFYVCDLPSSPSFTGQISLVFNFKGGSLMKAEIHKNSSVAIVNDPVDKQVLDT